MLYRPEIFTDPFHIYLDIFWNYLELRINCSALSNMCIIVKNSRFPFKFFSVSLLNLEPSQLLSYESFEGYSAWALFKNVFPYFLWFLWCQWHPRKQVPFCHKTDIFFSFLASVRCLVVENWKQLASNTQGKCYFKKEMSTFILFIYRPRGAL